MKKFVTCVVNNPWQNSQNGSSGISSYIHVAMPPKEGSGAVGFYVKEFKAPVDLTSRLIASGFKPGEYDVDFDMVGTRSAVEQIVVNVAPLGK